MFKQLLATVVLTCSLMVTSVDAATHQRVVHEDWSPDVKNAINDFLDTYGIDSPNYRPYFYVVFDFDDTMSVFDVQRQCGIHQLEKMAFAMRPREFAPTLMANLPQGFLDMMIDEKTRVTFRDRINDMAADYEILWQQYGPFDGAGVREEARERLQSDAHWLSFFVNMKDTSSLLQRVTGTSSVWEMCWRSGLSNGEIYRLSREAIRKYKAIDTVAAERSTTAGRRKTGPLTYSWLNGIQVAENMRELWEALYDNGINIWVCSDSGTEEIRAAVDEFGLHKYCKGVLGMTMMSNVTDVRQSGYDWKGKGYYCKYNGAWEKMKRAEGAQTYGLGKVAAIFGALVPEYKKHGPIAGFMDSSADFNFCTEFSSLKLVMCMNKGNATMLDGDGLIGVLAMHQRYNLGYDLAKANANGDTLFVLQGRDERGIRCLRPFNSSMVFDAEQERLFAYEDGWKLFNFCRQQKISTEKFLNTFALQTPDSTSPIGYAFGCLNEYAGYHSR